MNDELMIASSGDRFTVIDEHGALVRLLAAGDEIGLSIRGSWQVARVQSGGYKGWYYVTASGERGRFALCMKVRLLLGTSPAGEVPNVDQAQDCSDYAVVPDDLSFPSVLSLVSGVSPIVLVSGETARLNAEFCRLSKM